MRWDDRIGHRLRLRDLHILLAVIQHGTMAKAATQLSISQPAVSKAISDLEHALGLRLLDRARHGVVPTIYGQALARRGVAVFDELGQGIAELGSLADPATGSLRIGSSEGMAAGFLPRVIDRLSRQHPGLILDVTQAVVAATQYAELRERRVDVLLGRVYSPIAEDDLNVMTLFDDQVVVVAGRRNRWALRRKLDLADLADERWILPQIDSPAGALTAEAFQARGLQMPKAAVTSLSIHMCLRLLSTGRFVATLPASVLHFSGMDLALKVLPVTLPSKPRPIGIVTVKNRTPNPATKLFVDCAAEIAKSMQATPFPN